MASKTKYKDLLDYTISYKAVWTVIGVAFALLVAGVIAWGRMKPAGDDEKARMEVKAAERLLQRADGCAQDDLKPEQQKMLSEGKEALEAARSALTLRKFGEAGASAHDAQQSLKDFVEKVCAVRDAVAEFVRIQGDVKVKKVQSPRWVPARKGQLAVGDRIWAQDGMAQIAYKMSNDLQEIRPGTIVEIKDVFQRADGVTGMELSIEKGETAVKSAAGSPSFVRAPHDVTVELGGDDVEIETPEGGAYSRVTGHRGLATVKQGDSTVKLDRNMRVEATQSGLSAPTKALTSPEMKEPIEGRVFSADKPEDKIIVFKWLPLDEAQGYKFQLARNDVFVPVLNAGDMERMAQPEVEVDAPTPNTYFWRVAGIDKQGIAGTWSEVRRFTVRGTVPQGKGPPPPTITLNKPLELGDRAIVKGKTQQYVTLEAFLNGRKYTDVPVDENGDFQLLVTLSQEGKNIIEFVDHDTYGQETREKVTARFTL